MVQKPISMPIFADDIHLALMNGTHYSMSNNTAE